MIGRLLRAAAIGAIVGFVLIQAVPYGRDHSNPPVVAEPAWDSPRTRELAVGACFDCHSNETRWPWYSNVAPMSWLVQRDVRAGREAWNVSEPDFADEGDEAAETVREGTMPLFGYTLLHAEARLDDAAQAALIAGLEATFGGEDRSGRNGGGDRNDDD